VSGRAARCAGVAARAWHGVSGRGSPGTTKFGSSRAWAGPKKRAFGRAFGLRAKWPSILEILVMEFLGIDHTRKVHGVDVDG
jgi:hypothetical protein